MSVFGRPFSREILRDLTKKFDVWVTPIVYDSLYLEREPRRLLEYWGIKDEIDGRLLLRGIRELRFPPKEERARGEWVEAIGERLPVDQEHPASTHRNWALAELIVAGLRGYPILAFGESEPKTATFLRELGVKITVVKETVEAKMRFLHTKSFRKRALYMAAAGVIMYVTSGVSSVLVPTSLLGLEIVIIDP